ncbi:hypothetical protein F9K77_20380 [Ochrobactrum sp. LMG 5442]|nr:hypothetical protein F9K77_20380 [Ochrobactrum sp. LMG 5442]
MIMSLQSRAPLMTSPDDFLAKLKWSWGMACAWIIHRDFYRSAETVDAETPKDLPLYYEIDEKSEQLHAEKLLIEALKAGEVAAIGWVGGNYRAIGVFEWIDAEEFPTTRCLGMGPRRRTLGMGYRLLTADGDDISDLQLNGRQMLRRWPPLDVGRETMDSHKATRPAHRPRTLRDNVILAIQDLFPEGEYEKIKRESQLAYVNEWLAKRDIAPVHKATLLRAIREMLTAQK